MKNKKPSRIEFASKRVFFNSNKIRDKFFSMLKKKFGSWTKISKHYNIYKSRLEHFRKGTISLPHNTFLKLISNISTKDRELFLKEIILKEPNWGRKKGGFITSKKYPEIFRKGRLIAIKKNKAKYYFDFDTKLDENLCELIGAFIGDGFTNKYDRACMTQFTGHAKLDKEYITHKLKNIIKQLSPNSNPIITKKDNALRMTIYSKDFFILLTKRFKLPKGKKCYSVKIPEEIIKSKKQELVNACIRGIFDTDGYVFFDKRKSYHKPYLRIGLQMESKDLIKQTHDLLKKQEIKSTITKDFKKIQINGKKECIKFIKKVGFSNSRHLSKLKELV